MLHKVEFVILICIMSLVVNLILRIKLVLKEIRTIIDDTMKVNDGTVRRYSGTKITMFIAFVSVLWGFHYVLMESTIVEVIITVFITMACIATGVAVTSAWSKKINPPSPTDEPKN